MAMGSCVSRTWAQRVVVTSSVAPGSSPKAMSSWTAHATHCRLVTRAITEKRRPVTSETTRRITGTAEMRATASTSRNSGSLADKDDIFDG